MNDIREHREHAVLQAAREEREARVALEQVEPPSSPHWDAEHEALYRARLDRWLKASRRLGNALQALKHRLAEANH